MVGPLNLVFKQHKQKLEKNSKFCKQEKQKAKVRLKKLTIK
jgi:hypothetical protein